MIAVALLEKIDRAVREKQIMSKTYHEKIEIAEMMKLITTDEVNQLRETFDASVQIINVDDFSS